MLWTSFIYGVDSNKWNVKAVRFGGRLDSLMHCNTDRGVMEINVRCIQQFKVISKYKMTKNYKYKLGEKKTTKKLHIFFLFGPFLAKPINEQLGPKLLKPN